MWTEILLLVAVGGVIAWLGYLIQVKQRIDLIHQYHHRRVKPEDQGAYCRLMGKALYIMGGTIALSGVAAAYVDEVIMTTLLFAGILAGLLVVHKAQKRYNGGWFS